MVHVEFTFPQISDFSEGGEFYAQPIPCIIEFLVIIRERL